MRSAKVPDEKSACYCLRYDRVKKPGVDDRALASSANEYENKKGYSNSRMTVRIISRVSLQRQFSVLVCGTDA